MNKMKGNRKSWNDIRILLCLWKEETQNNTWKALTAMVQDRRQFPLFWKFFLMPCIACMLFIQNLSQSHYYLYVQFLQTYSWIKKLQILFSNLSFQYYYFYYYPWSRSTSLVSYQNVLIMIRHHVLWDLIWVCTVSECVFKGSLNIIRLTIRRCFQLFRES